MRFTLAAVAAVALPALVAADGDFVTSCDSATIKVSGQYLTAKCRNIVGAQACSKLDLNNCLKNSYGNLLADPTSEGCVFPPSPRFLGNEN